MKRTGLRIFCLVLSITAVWTFTGCGIIIINDRNEMFRNTESAAPDSENTNTDTSSEGKTNSTEKNKEKNADTTGGGDGGEALPNDLLAKKYLLAIQRKKFNNITFIITTTDRETISPEEITSEMGEARLERNHEIEKRFEVALVTRSTDINTIYDSTKNAVLSDTYYTDLLAIPQCSLGAFYAGGLLINMKNLPYLIFTSPYFNQSSIDAASGGFGVYGISGEAVFNPNRMAGIYINKNLISEAGMELPYKNVYDGTWTWDKLYEISSSVISSLDAGADERNIYSVTSMLGDDADVNLIYASTGKKYMTSQVMSIPAVGFSPDSAAAQIETIKSYLNDGNRYTGGEQQEALSEFNGGNSVYMIARMYVMSWMPNSETDWGVVPFPKNSQGQAKYATLADSNALMFSVTANNNNVDAASIVLQALNAASYKHITDKFITYHMNRVVRDNDTLNMLEIIMESQVFDFALVFGDAYTSVKEGTVSGIYRAASGESIQEIYENNFAVITDAMEKAFSMNN